MNSAGSGGSCIHPCLRQRRSEPAPQSHVIQGVDSAIAIEVGNPFDKIIPFGGETKLQIRVTQNNGAAQVFAWQVPDSTPNIPARAANDSPATQEQMVFYSNIKNAGVATEPTEATKGKSIVADLGLGGAYTDANMLRDMGDGLMADANITVGGDFTVELQGLDEATGTYVTYDRLTKAGFKYAQEYNGVSGAVVTPEPRAHEQVCVQRDGVKNRFISNKSKTLAVRSVGGSLTAGDFKNNNTTLTKFGIDNKGFTGDAALDNVQIAHNNHRFMNVTELGYVFMFGFYNAQDGDFPTRISGADGNATTGTASKARWFLSLTDAANQSLTPTQGQIVIPGNVGIPHMAMVFDQFTVYSPRWDGYDNDNNDADNTVTSGADNEEEQFVPGLMNINTAPWWLLAMVNPMPDLSLGQGVWGNEDMIDFFAAFAVYRDRPGVGNRHRELTVNDATLAGKIRNNFEKDKGMRSVGEMMLFKYANKPGGDTLAYGGTSSYTSSAPYQGATAATDVRRIYPNRDLPATASNNVRYSDEYPSQERMTRLHFLNSVFTTRSDRYCAYVVIREYNSASFTTATDTLRFFVLLDRSRVIDSASKVIATPKSGQINK